MDDGILKVKIPYILDTNGKIVNNLKEKIQEYLNSFTIKELSSIACVVIENDIYIDSTSSEDMEYLETSHCIGIGHFGEIADDYVEYVFINLIEPYSIDLSSVKFANAVIDYKNDNEIDSIRMIHIYGSVKKE